MGYIRHESEMLSSKLMCYKQEIGHEDVSDFKKDQIVMAKWLDQSISKTAALIRQCFPYVDFTVAGRHG